MHRKNALYLALHASISGLPPITMAANPPAAEMDSAPVEARPNAAALGGAELRSLATGSAHAPRLIELGAPDSAQAATMKQLRGQQVKHGPPLQIGFSRDIAKPAINLRRLSWQSLPNGAQVTRFESVSTDAAALRAALQLSGSGAQPGDPSKATPRFAGDDGRVFAQSGADFAGSEPGWSAKAVPPARACSPSTAAAPTSCAAACTAAARIAAHPAIRITTRASPTCIRPSNPT